MTMRETLLKLEKWIDSQPRPRVDLQEAKKYLNDIRMDIQVIIMERIEVGEIKLVLESQDLKFKKIESLCEAVTKTYGLIGPKGQLPMVPVAAIRKALGLEAFPFQEERKRKRTEERKRVRGRDWKEIKTEDHGEASQKEMIGIPSDNMKVCPICQESGGCEHMIIVTDIDGDKENDK